MEKPDRTALAVLSLCFALSMLGRGAGDAFTVVYGLGLLLLGAGFSLAAFSQALWQLQLCVGLAAGLGAACLGNVTNSLLLGRWFGRRLPTAMAVVYSAAGQARSRGSRFRRC
jgi:hypothetical protein